MRNQLRSYLEALDVDSVASARCDKLAELSSYVRERRAAGLTAPLTFICTHNSRRSHFGQIWAAATAALCKVPQVHTFSGGTEATAFNPRAVAAIERAGFSVRSAGGDNPRYAVSWSNVAPAIQCFSKKYDHAVNPTVGFAAVMTCSDADDACPVIPGAALRLSLPYDDPKSSDDSPEEAATYDARCREIATEMLFMTRALLPSP